MGLTGHFQTLQWPWAGAIAAGILAGLLGWWLTRERSASGALPVSHSHRLFGLPRYAALVARRRWLVALRAVAAVVLVGGCLLLASRPSDLDTQTRRASRDVVICLDVSPSMRRTAADVSRVFQEVVRSLPGDRIGLTVFDGQTVVKFPLTDAEQYVGESLQRAEAAFQQRDHSYTRSAIGYPSSQLGDGLYSCVASFDRLDERRGRAVLVASDNHPYGRPAHTLEDAARLARQRGVVVYGLGVPALERRPRARDAFRTATASTGGQLAMAADAEAVGEVVERIDRLERRRLEEPPRTVIDDRPRSGVLLALAGFAGLVALGVRRST